MDGRPRFSNWLLGYSRTMSNTTFPYHSAELESVRCNLCGRDDAAPVHRRDRNGLPVTTVICRHCGLLYLNPRMTREWYGKYYQTEYRAQMARFKGKTLEAPDFTRMFEKATRHGVGLAERFKGSWADGLTIEVGSSSGGVLNGLRQVLGVEVLGIEPSPDESQEASARGVKTICALMENVGEETPQAGNVLCTQSLNHLLDPRYFLEWSHRRLRPGGRLVLEVMNFRHVFRHFGWIERAIQIDHTYMFVPEVLEVFVGAAGFKLLKMEADETRPPQELAALKKAGMPVFHVGLIAEKLDAAPFSDPAAIPKLYEQVWQSLAAVPNSALKYRIKRLFRKWLK